MGRINVRIIGAGPTGLLLAASLARLDINVYIYDFVNQKSLISKEKTYAITHSSKRILEKFSLWDLLKSNIYGFNSLSISDTLIKKSALFSINDLSPDLENSRSIGWVIKHSVLTRVLLERLSNHENVTFTNKYVDRISRKDFDYEFIADGANSCFKKINGLLNFKNNYNQSCLTFKVRLRGNVKKRAYEIFRDEGPLALLPLSDNIYQVIWTSDNLIAKERINLNRSFLLDNLSVTLPRDLKLDEIIGDVNCFPVSLSFTVPSFDFKKVIFVGDALHTFHPVGGQGLNACWRDVNEIYNCFCESHNNKKRLSSLKFRFYTNRLLDIFSIFFTTHNLIVIFANRNLFLIPLRKMSFFFLNRFSIIRRFLFSYMTKSLSFRSIRKFN